MPMARTAVIGGVGAGLGESIARKLVAEGCEVGLIARSEDYLAELAAELGDGAVAAPADLSEEDELLEAVERIRAECGTIDIVVNHAAAASWEGFGEISTAEFRRAWEVTTLGAFHLSAATVPEMRAQGEGTVLFTGATSAVRGRAGAVGFSSAKFANRGLAESMARELGPEGIHVAHVIIDGQILTPRARERTPDRDPETFLDPDAIADVYWDLIEQDRSAWTLELDLRPHVEDF